MSTMAKIFKAVDEGTMEIIKVTKTKIFLKSSEGYKVTLEPNPEGWATYQKWKDKNELLETQNSDIMCPNCKNKSHLNPFKAPCTECGSDNGFEKFEVK